MPTSEPVEALEALLRADVELIVVGMASAILQGAPMLTNDIDIVHRRTPENVQRLLGVLRALNAVFRADRRRLTPSASQLLGPGHLLLDTRLGDLDCLGTIDEGLGYEELLPDSVEIDLGEGLRCRALSLEKYIELKRRTGRAKDLAVLPVLNATLDEIRKRERL